jgi:hypothetical protein
MKSGDDFAATVDFSVPMTGHSVAASLHSVVTGQQVGTFTITMVDVAAGKVGISLTDSQTSSLAPGTYSWRMTSVQGSTNKTYLQGHAEVVR